MKITLIDSREFFHEEEGEMENAIADALMELNREGIRKDEHGFLMGHFRLKLEYIDNESPDTST